METIIERLDEYLRTTGMSGNRLEVMCGLPKGTLSKARSGKTDIGKVNAARVLDKFHDLSRVWLLTGEGPMLKPTAANIVENTTNNGRITQTSGAESSALDKALDEIAEQRRLVATSQGQIDRLLVIIEQMTKK